MFDEYNYNSETPPQGSQNSDAEEDSSTFEIPLNTLIECLNIFGTAGSSVSAAGSGGTSGKYKKWKRAGDDSDQEGDHDGRGRRHSNGTSSTKGIDSYFGSTSDKGTGMRMTYIGSGYPLTLLM